MPTFTFQLHLKTNGTQYCLRSLPGNFDALASWLADLRHAVEAHEPWSAGKVHVCWNNTSQYDSTLSYYPDAGYLEINVNVSTPLCNFAEQWEANGQLPTLFSATYSERVSPTSLATINLVKQSDPTTSRRADPVRGA
jgi:hypothetical protein